MPRPLLSRGTNSATSVALDVGRENLRKIHFCREHITETELRVRRRACHYALCSGATLAELDIDGLSVAASRHIENRLIAP